MLLVTIGYKTKLSALILVFWLTARNFYLHCWWTIPEFTREKDFMMYKFFQVLLKNVLFQDVFLQKNIYLNFCRPFRSSEG